MNFLLNFLEKIKNKPEKERIRIVFVLSLITTIILILIFQKFGFFKPKEKKEKMKPLEEIKKEFKEKESQENKIPSLFDLFSRKEAPRETSFFPENFLKEKDQTLEQFPIEKKDYQESFEKGFYRE